MNPQMATHQQPQNGSQQRQMPNAQQKGSQGQQQTQAPYANFDPILTFWSLEKPKNADSWADVKPQEQHISLEELQDELEKFKRKDLTVKGVLDEVKSTNCRKQINILADDQTKELQKSNRTLKYIIGGILLDWRYIDRRKRERTLNRVYVILQTVPSGLFEPQVPKPTGGSGGGIGNAQGVQSLKQPAMAPGQQQHGNTQGQGPNMAQQPRTVPQQGQQHMGPSHFDLRPPGGGGQGQIHVGGNAPPPPPPGGHQVHGLGGSGAPPPPPPPPGGYHGQPHVQHNPQMPGTYPVPMPKGTRPGPYIETLDAQFKHSRKSKHKGRHGISSDEDSNDWDTETGSSGSDSYRVRSVEGDFGLVDEGRRGRAKSSKHTKKAQRHKSQSRVRSRSVSKARQDQHTRRRNSDSSNSRSGRHSPSSLKAKSPYNSSSDEGRHGHKKHKHRVRSSVSPTRAYNNKTFEKFATSPSMSRHSSQRSWSDVTSSDHSEGHDRRDRGHGHTRTRSRSRHRHSRSHRSKQDDPDRRYNIRESRADDYPYDTPPRERDQYRDEQTLTGRPLPQRRATTQAPLPNPFFAAATPPLRQNRETPYSTYPADMNAREYQFPQQPQRYAADMNEREQLFPQQQQRYAAAHGPAEQDRFGMNDIVDALYDRIAKTGEAQHMPPLGRQQAERRSGGLFNDEGMQRMPPLRRHHTERRHPGNIDEDEWDRRYPSARGPPLGAYGRYGL
jgi:hypothetical protein